MNLKSYQAPVNHGGNSCKLYVVHVKLQTICAKRAVQRKMHAQFKYRH